MTHKRALTLVAAVTVTTLTLLRTVGDHHRAAAQGALPAAASTAAASTIAVRLVHALTDDDPGRASVTITATTTPSLARALLEARAHTRMAATPDANLTVTSVAVDARGRRADAHVAGQLTTDSAPVAVSWMLLLVANHDGGWRIEAVS